MKLKANNVNKLNIELKNCYGIKKLNYEFDFSECNTFVIYAPNGSMKTSLAKVFKNLQDGEKELIKDEIFNYQPVIKTVQLNDLDINQDEIFVIKSFDNFYESKNMASLLINDSLKLKLFALLKKRDLFFKILEKISGLKISKISQGKKIDELESTLLFDFNITGFLQNLNKFNIENNQEVYEVQYSEIFDLSVLKIIESQEFQQNIKSFLNINDEIYADFSFLEKGKFSLGKLKEVSKRLNDNNFFVGENKLFLDGLSHQISSIADLDAEIKVIEDKLKNTKEFQAIEKSLSTSKGLVLKDILENYPELVEKLKLENIDNFKRELWLSYFKQNEQKFKELKADFDSFSLEKEITSFDDTPWKKAYNIFKQRFTVPFEMSIKNIKSSILGESLPKVIFEFYDKKKDVWLDHSREKIESDILSQGEKRALYLLNIIFDIEDRKKKNKKTFFIVDDIADSFDYKNKYAIVEYLNDLFKEDNFYSIILTHNFDFYRTITSRLELPRDHKLHAIKINDEIEFITEVYQNLPFKTWIETMKKGQYYDKNYTEDDAKKHVVVLIPFVRNLIEYSNSTTKAKSTIYGYDFDVLTSLLHFKTDTKKITFGDLKKIYRTNINKDDFDQSILDAEIVYDKLFNLANIIKDNEFNLENKIILAMVIRHKAEEYMWSKVLKKDPIQGCQTGKLFKRLKSEFEKNPIPDEVIKVLESVNIMTPENIHLNSFMYEPILDMGIDELKTLYDKVCTLNQDD